MKAQVFSFTLLIVVVLCLWASKAFGKPFPDKPAVRLGRGTINDIAYSPDGQLLAVAGSQIWLYDTADLTEIAVLYGHTDIVNSVVFSPDGSLLASGGEDQTVRIWEVPSRRQVGRLEHSSGVSSISISRDGTLLAAASNKNVVLWSLETQQQVGHLEEHTDIVNRIAISPDGQLLASGDSNAVVRLWEIETQRLVSQYGGPLPVDEFVSDGVTSIAFSPDGKLLASVVNGQVPGGGVVLWEVEQQRSIASFGHFYGMEQVAFSPEGEILAAVTSFPERIHLLQVPSLQDLDQVKLPPTGNNRGLSFSPDERQLAVADRFNVRFWCNTFLSRNCIPLNMLYHSGVATFLAFGADSNTLVSSSVPRGFLLNHTLFWDTATGREVGQLNGYDRVDASVDGKFLAYQRRDFDRNATTIDFWEIDVQQQVSQLEIDFDSFLGHISPVAINADGNTLAIARTQLNPLGGVVVNTIQLWDVAGQQLLGALKTQGNIFRSDARSLAFSPDGQLLASAEMFEGVSIIELWDVNTLQLVGQLEGSDNTFSIQKIGFSPDGKTLATWESTQLGSVYDIFLWDVASQQYLEQFSTEAPSFSFAGFAFSPDSQTFAFPGDDVRSILLWNLQTHKVVGELDMGGLLIDSLAFSLDGKWLASGASDGTILLWELSLTSPKPTWDVNADGTIDVFDLILVGSQFGQAGIGLTGDVNSDGIVDVLDLVVVGSHFGEVTIAAPKAFVPALPQAQAGIQQALTQLESMENPPDGALVAIKFLRTWLSEVNPTVTETQLLQNYPNPFNPETWIPFALHQAVEVEIGIYDAAGHMVRTLQLGEKTAGIYRSKTQAAYWDGNNAAGEAVSSGVYFFQLRGGEQNFTRRAILLK